MEERFSINLLWYSGLCTRAVTSTAHFKISTTIATTLIDRTTCNAADRMTVMEDNAFISSSISLLMPQSYAGISNDANLLHEICLIGFIFQQCCPISQKKATYRTQTLTNGHGTDKPKQATRCQAWATDHRKSQGTPIQSHLC